MIFLFVSFPVKCRYCRHRNSFQTHSIVRLLLDSIPITRRVKVSKEHGGGYKEVADIKGLRDRAAIAIMAYTFGRVSAVAGVRRGSYRLEGKRARLRLLEKGSKELLVWLHHEAESYLDAYIAAAGIDDMEAPLFQSLDKAHKPSGEAISRRDMLRMVKARCADCGVIGGLLQPYVPGYGHDSVP
jgi:integrase